MWRIQPTTPLDRAVLALCFEPVATRGALDLLRQRGKGATHLRPGRVTGTAARRPIVKRTRYERVLDHAQMPIGPELPTAELVEIDLVRRQFRRCDGHAFNDDELAAPSTVIAFSMTSQHLHDPFVRSFSSRPPHGHFVRKPITCREGALALCIPATQLQDLLVGEFGHGVICPP